MNRLSLAQITMLGRKVDPIILRALSRGSAAEFLPCLKYHFRVGGKRMRAAMVMLCCAASGGRIEDSLNPAAAVEMVHNYSLVMDDIIDRGEVRRGKPTVRVEFGDSTSLLVAMFYREVLDDLIQEGPRSNVIRLIAVRTMKEIIDGERIDLQFEQAGRDDPFLAVHRIRKPSFQLYLKMIGKKTASLFQAAAEIGAHSAEANSRIVHALSGFGWKSGLAFQIMDDVLDIFGEGTGKQEAKDVIEHKLGNAAIMMAMRFLRETERAELESILKSPRVSRSQAARAGQLVMKTPAELACRQVASEYLREAKEHLSALRNSKYAISLSDLGDRVIARAF